MELSLREMHLQIHTQGVLSKQGPGTILGTQSKGSAAGGVPSPAAQHGLQRPAGSSGFTQSCWSSDLGQQKQQKENENKNSGLQHKTHSPLTSFHAFKIKPGCRLISLGFHDSVSFLHTRMCLGEISAHHSSFGFWNRSTGTNKSNSTLCGTFL